jgi:hypothetical protein
VQDGGEKRVNGETGLKDMFCNAKRGFGNNKIITEMKKYLYFALFIMAGCTGKTPEPVSGMPDIHKIKDVVIYRDTLFYSTFPSVVRRPDGKLLVAFRRAPDRRLWGDKNHTHIDPNSYLVMVRSDDGENWSKEPELIYAHPFGGSQDPCLLQLKDGSLLCASYGWSPKSEFLGGYILRSQDGGKTWQGPFYPLHVPSESRKTPAGNAMPAYNRGAMYESKSGRILWAVAAVDSTKRTSVHLITSDDKGMTWNYGSLIAADDSASFNETSVYETPGGDIVAFLRTAGMDDQACIARSTDGGKSFQWQSMGFRGHPLNALRLPDNRVLLTYGYRHQPYGIRARILNAECTDFSTTREFVLRDDGGNTDIGYTWPVILDGNSVLVVYYFNLANGVRYIGGTVIEIK